MSNGKDIFVQLRDPEQGNVYGAYLIIRPEGDRVLLAVSETKEYDPKSFGGGMSWRGLRGGDEFVITMWNRDELPRLEKLGGDYDTLAEGAAILKDLSETVLNLEKVGHRVDADMVRHLMDKIVLDLIGE